jgi:prevent-host-death family protein
MEKTGIEEARKALGEIVNRALFSDQPTLITRNGVPAAVVVSEAWYRAALDRMDLAKWPGHGVAR